METASLTGNSLPEATVVQEPHLYSHSFICSSAFLFLRTALSISNVSSPVWGGVNLIENAEDMVSTLMELADEKRKCAQCLDGRSIEYHGDTEQRESFQEWGTLDSTRDRVAGRGTPESPKGLVNPMEWCFTGYKTTIKRVLGQGNTSHYSLKEVWRCLEHQ